MSIPLLKISFLKTLLILLTISCQSLAQATNSDSLDDDITNYDEYDENYNNNEGKLILKIRAAGIQSEGKQKSLPPSTISNPKTAGPLNKNGFGVDAATTIFLNDYVAAELGVGFNALRTKHITLSNIANNYNGAVPTKSSKNIYSVPISLVGQYYIAPFGAISPYVGLGYHFAYNFTKAKQFKIGNGHGAVLQVGVDLIAKDNTFINLEVKQYFMSAKVKYSNVLVNNQNVSSKTKFNPLVFLAGVGFKL